MLPNGNRLGLLLAAALLMSATACGDSGGGTPGVFDDLGNSTGDSSVWVPTDTGTPARPDIPVKPRDVVDTYVEPDVPDTVEGPGYPPCEDNTDCPMGFCVMTAEGKVCPDSCIENCPSAWSCVNVATPPDLLYLCVPDHPFICHPCTESADCGSLAGTENLCVRYADEGWFCGGVCAGDEDCPGGYVCSDVEVREGGTAKQCVRPEGICDCTRMAIGKTTFCMNENEHGRCEVPRSCTTDGLESCIAPPPAREICNEKDDDCDGDTDENCDGDDIPPAADNCPADYNPLQEDHDGDNRGDMCDGDDDNDGYADDDDCEPLDRVIHPNADELCDGKDNDCDGGTDEGLCDDGNYCTDDVCNAQGICQYNFNGLECDDGNICTTEDRCAGGNCVGGAFLDCNDDQPCTGDSCDPILGCVHHELEGPCEDGDPCTDGEYCVDMECIGGLPKDCDDNDPCTDDYCDPVEGCVHDDQNPCDDGNPCTDDLCQAGTGCINTPNIADCDDGSVCTTYDVCRDGICTGTIPLDCDDGNACTDDLCHPTDGCYAENNEAPCEDGNPCTVGETCRNGFCSGGQPDACDDGNPCTADSCLPTTGCLHLEDNPCDDGNPCTADTCDPIQGCQYPAAPGSCNDNNPCTEGDHCEEGVCVGVSERNCDDGNPCTDDLCSASGGCYSVNNAAACEDGNPCTLGDTCRNGFCVSGTEFNTCDDGEICTLDSCDPTQGCRHTQYNPCDDANPCTTDTCQLGSGCQYEPNTNLCDDGNRCTAGDHCEDGVCVGTDNGLCDDGNPCTVDECLPGGSCRNTPREGSCDDGNFCTVDDYCYNGRCMPGTPRNCNDSNGCTSDRCDPAQGCVNDASSMNGASCDDDDGCTGGDTCGGGSCNGGYSACGYENNCPGYVWVGTCVDIGGPVCLGACF